MGSNLSISIEGYKVNSDGSIREKFTTVVLRDGIEEAFLDNYSEGEKTRIIVAGTLAINSLLNDSCGYGKGLEIIVMDELLGSLDRLGVQNVINALNGLNSTILAVSHVEPRGNYTNTMRIVKENGVSTINNGLSLCKFHHAAFDRFILGVTPEYKVHIREDILNEIDGPMLQHGLKELHNNKIILPTSKHNYPGKEFLDWRYEKFKRVG